MRVKVDDRDQSPGWKFAEHEMRGVPVRIEIGPKDIENDQCIAAVRYSGEKITISLENNLETFGNKILDLLGNEIPKGMYEKALQNRTNRTYQCKTVDEINAVLNEKGDGFVEAMWCGDEACEDKVKELTGAGSRCIPFEQHEYPTSAYAAESPPSIWCSGARRIDTVYYFRRTVTMKIVRRFLRRIHTICRYA